MSVPSDGWITGEHRSGGAVEYANQGRRRWRPMLAIAVVALGFAAVAYAAAQQKLGSISDPGPGFWPLACSMIGLACCLIAAADTAFGRTDSASDEAPSDDKPPIEWKRLTLFFIISAAFLAFYPLLGFIITAMSFTFLLLWLVSRVRLVVAVPAAVVSTIVLYVVFAQLLNVRI